MHEDAFEQEFVPDPNLLITAQLQGLWNQKVTYVENPKFFFPNLFYGLHYKQSFVYWEEKPNNLMIGNGTNKFRQYTVRLDDDVFKQLLTAYFKIVLGESGKDFTLTGIYLSLSNRFDYIPCNLRKVNGENLTVLYRQWVKNITKELEEKNLDPRTNMGEILIKLFHDVLLDYQVYLDEEMDKPKDESIVIPDTVKQLDYSGDYENSTPTVKIPLWYRIVNFITKGK